MIRIYAGPLSACMVDLKSRWNFTYKFAIRNAVSLLLPNSIPNDPVS
jgi:hypothetical protein